MKKKHERIKTIWDLVTIAATVPFDIHFGHDMLNRISEDIVIKYDVNKVRGNGVWPHIDYSLILSDLFSNDLIPFLTSISLILTVGFFGEIISENIARKINNEKTVFEEKREERNLEKMVNKRYNEVKKNINIRKNEEFKYEEFESSFIDYLKVVGYVKKPGFNIDKEDDFTGMAHVKFWFSKMFSRDIKESLNTLLKMIHYEYRPKQILRYWDEINKKYFSDKDTGVINTLIKEYCGLSVKTDLSDLIVDIESKGVHEEIKSLNKKNEVYKIAILNSDESASRSKKYVYILKKSKNKDVIIKEKTISDELGKLSQSLSLKIKIPRILDLGIDVNDDVFSNYMVSETAPGIRFDKLLSKMKPKKRLEKFFEFLDCYVPFVKEVYSEIKPEKYGLRKIDYNDKIKRVIVNDEYEDSLNVIGNLSMFFSELNHLEQRFVHGDLHTKNIIVHENVYSLFDFEDSGIGNLFYDPSYLSEQRWNQNKIDDSLSIIADIYGKHNKSFNKISNKELKRVILKNIIFSDLLINGRFSYGGRLNYENEENDIKDNRSRKENIEDKINEIYPMNSEDNEDNKNNRDNEWSLNNKDYKNDGEKINRTNKSYSSFWADRALIGLNWYAEEFYRSEKEKMFLRNELIPTVKNYLNWLIEKNH